MRRAILIAENERAMAEALVGRLRARDFEVLLAVDAEHALALFNSAQPDLVIISLTLPEGSGLALCRSVRSQTKGGMIPVLFLGTGKEEVRSNAEAIAAGADLYFIKPSGIESLLARVPALIGGGELPTPPLEQPERTPPPRRARPEPKPPEAEPETWEDERRRQPDRRAGTPRRETLPPLERRAGVDRREPPREEPFAPPSAPSEPDEAWAALLEVGNALPLERRGVGEILAAAYRAQLSGRVELAAGGVLRRVFFESGRPIFADSSASSEDLAASLAAEGRLARSVLTQIRQRSAQLGTSPEELLIDAGFLSADELYAALCAHVQGLILGLFGLEAGDALVIRGGARPPDPVDLGVSPARLILDGIRRKYGRLRLYRAFGTASAVPRPVPGAERPAGLVLRADEEAVFAACDGRRTALELARATGLGEVDVLAVLYGLAVLELVIPPRGRKGGVLPALRPETVAMAGAPRTSDQLPGFAELVEAKFSEVQTADYHRILGVDRAANAAELKSAYETLRQRFDPHRVRRDGALWHRVSEIAAIIDDAFAVLSDERLRTLYERALS